MRLETQCRSNTSRRQNKWQIKPSLGCSVKTVQTSAGFYFVSRVCVLTTCFPSFHTRAINLLSYLSCHDIKVCLACWWKILFANNYAVYYVVENIIAATLSPTLRLSSEHMLLGGSLYLKRLKISSAISFFGARSPCRVEPLTLNVSLACSANQNM